MIHNSFFFFFYSFGSLGGWGTQCPVNSLQVTMRYRSYKFRLQYYIHTWCQHNCNINRTVQQLLQAANAEHEPDDNKYIIITYKLSVVLICLRAYHIILYNSSNTYKTFSINKHLFISSSNNTSFNYIPSCLNYSVAAGALPNRRTWPQQAPKSARIPRPKDK